MSDFKESNNEYSSLFQTQLSGENNSKKIDYKFAEKILTKLILEIQILPKENGGVDFYYLKSFYGDEMNEIEGYLNYETNEEKLNNFHNILCTEADYENMDEKNISNKKEIIIYKNYQRFLNFLNDLTLRK